MSKIITDDPMIEAANRAAEMDRAAFAMAKQIEMSMLIAAFTHLALEYDQKSRDSGEFDLEACRGLAEDAEAFAQRYSGFILERMGLVKIEQVDKP